MALDDKYDIEASIHIGQITSAHPAVEIATGRRVLLKTLHPQWSQDREISERFSREAAALARINHPRVVRAIDQGREDGLAYIALEWIDGGNLAERMADGPLPQDYLKELAAGILEGLQAVHEAGLVHRDLKPDNILLDSQGQPLLADFSLAGFSERSDLTEHGAMVGSPAYMAPELLQGKPADARSDLFGVGVVLLEALTGSNPYRAADPLATLERLNRIGSPRLRERSSIDPALAALIDSLLERDPQARPTSAAEALAIIRGEEIKPVPKPVETSLSLPTPQRRTSRRSLYYGLSTMLLLITAALLYFSDPSFPLRSSILKPDSAVSASDTSLMEPDSLAAALIPARDTSSVALPMTTFPAPVDTAILSRDTAQSARAALTARLSVIARPWARIYIDGVYRGITPLGTIELPAGKHAISFRSEAFPTIERAMTLKANETLNLTVDLTQEAGQVAVSAEPWGYLWLDGDSLGLLPRADPLWLKPGGHLLRVTHPTLGEFRDSLRVEKGSRTGYLVNLVTGTMVANNKNG